MLRSMVLSCLQLSIEVFNNNYKKKYKSINYITKSVYYGFLSQLAHKYYETDLFSDFL